MSFKFREIARERSKQPNFLKPRANIAKYEFVDIPRRLALYRINHSATRCTITHVSTFFAFSRFLNESEATTAATKHGVGFQTTATRST